MPHNQRVAHIRLILEQAAKGILDFYRSGAYSVNVKPDKSPVTSADLISEKIIKEGLFKMEPGIPVVSEESTHDLLSGDKVPDDFWIVDPLDGTREFIKGNDEFCICLARINCGIVNEGYIYAPIDKILWSALKGSGAYKIVNNKIIKLPCSRKRKGIKILKSRSHIVPSEKQWIANLSGKMTVREEYQGSAIKFGRIADGTGDLYIKESIINKWDVAAGALIVEESGGAILSLNSGKRLSFNSPGHETEPFLAYGYRIKDPGALLSLRPLL